MVEMGTVALGSVVEIGSTVRVRDRDRTDTWTIVNDGESDPASGRISEDCAMAQALIGHVAGDMVRVRGSRQSWHVTILGVTNDD
jgi:transcription elongation GreA/GreB family factor